MGYSPYYGQKISSYTSRDFGALNDAPVTSLYHKIVQIKVVLWSPLSDGITPTSSGKESVAKWANRSCFLLAMWLLFKVKVTDNDTKLKMLQAPAINRTTGLKELWTKTARSVRWITSFSWAKHGQPNEHVCIITKIHTQTKNNSSILITCLLFSSVICRK